MSEIKPKRGPGRPPNDNKKSKEERKGVCDKPLCDGNAIEFYYTFPIIFKKIYALYKSINANNIYIIFNTDSVTLISKSYSDQCIVRAVIDCTNVHRYFCQKRLILKMSRKNSESIINRIDPKFYSSIKIVVHEYTNIVDNAVIIHYNNTLQVESIHRLNLCSTDECDIVEDWNHTLYPLDFTLERKDIKKFINDIGNISKGTMMIEKAGKYPLKFKYATECNVVTGTEVFKNDETIKLHSDLAATEIIATSINLADIKSITNVQISDKTNIFVDNKKKLLMKFNMDGKTVECKVLLAVEDYQNCC